MFQEMAQQLQTAEGKKIIKNYNRVAKVLLEFEVLYHREWVRQVRFHLTLHDRLTVSAWSHSASGHSQRLVNISLFICYVYTQ